MMRALVVAALAALPACGLEEIEVTLEGTAVLPSARHKSSSVVPDVPIDGLTGFRFTAVEPLARRGVTGADIERVQLESITISAPEGDLDLVDYVEIFVNAPGEPELPVAERHVPDGARSLDLEVFENELAPFARAPLMNLRGAFELRRQPQHDMALKVRARFRVEVTSAAF